MSCHGTIVDLLRERAAQNPDGVAYMFLGDGEAEDSKVTYSALDARSRAIGAHLASVVPKGERLLLSFPSGMQFIEAFFGCLYASLTAIPAYPLEPAHLNRTLPRCRAILREASPAAALTSAESYGVVREMEREFPDLGRTRWIITEEIPNALGTTWKDPGTSAQMLAVLQYTSGSTSSSKGVMLSHYSILQNERMIAGAFGHQRSLPFVGWVSLPHALGLMYHVLQPLYMGVPSIFMSPEAFLQKPVRWLRAISHYHAQASSAPNFGYDLCAQKITPEERDHLDLRTWTTAAVGTEPVRADTLDRFAAAFEQNGFRRSAFLVGYGLAEASLFVSGSQRNREPRVLRVQKPALEKDAVVVDLDSSRESIDIVSSGVPPPDQNVIIVDPETKIARTPGQVGEIWISGHNVADGYWNNRSETEQAFHCSVEGSQDATFLRTGDLGFIYDGELFVTGRLKDLIIISGRNLYPQDLEATVESRHPALSKGCVAVFSVPTNGREQVAIMCELQLSHRTGLNEIADSIRQAVFQEHEVLAEIVVFVENGGISRTLSGKIQRHACQKAYAAKTLPVIEANILGTQNSNPGEKRRLVAPSTQTERLLTEIWSEVLNVEEIGIYDNFLDIGGHSILATVCLNLIRKTFRIDLPLKVLLTERANVREISEIIDQLRRSSQNINQSREQERL